MLCRQCSTELPEAAQFCLNCGERVDTAAEKTSATDPSASSDSARRKPRQGSAHLLLWFFALLFLIAIAWVTTSNNSFAQGIQQLAGLQHDYAVVDSPFSVTAHNFRFYKFVLPPGSRNVLIVGDFTAAAENPGKRQADADADNNIEVYVLSEAAFPVWQNGYVTNSVYQSGKVSQAKIEAEIPDAGIYYIVFSNKFDPKASKKINTSVLLRYRSWMPRSWQQAGQRFWDWLGM